MSKKKINNKNKKKYSFKTLEKYSVEKYCHYSGLPSPNAYAKNDDDE